LARDFISEVDAVEIYTVESSGVHIGYNFSKK